MKKLTTLTGTVIIFLFSACQPGIQKGSALSRNHVNYIRGLGLLSGDEHIILFDSQYKIKVSGNFFTNRRIASYWIDERNPAKHITNYAFYRDIDSLKPHYIKALTYASFLKVYKTDGHRFNVYVEADSTTTKFFFDRAIAEWKRNKLTVLNRLPHNYRITE